jgi:2-polyprenyl-3-methyl-5-hydroxy-6-metoxy-1,4-benzoquinol methylase
MPRIKQNFVLTFAKDIKAFLRLDAGVGRRVPDDPEELLKHRNQRIQSLQQSLRGRAKGNKVKKRVDDKAHPVKEPQQMNRGRARMRPEERVVEASASEEITEQTHALPEPDKTISRREIFHSLVSPLKPGKMLDLGAGSGNFSLLAAQMGWEVTAVDARSMRTPDPETEEDPEQAELIRSIRWVESDVREFPIESERYDLICILGLMHHLEVEDQLKLLGRSSDALTLLDVRIAPEIVVTEGPYEGLYFHERGKSREGRERLPQASWGNELSFRHTEESLLRLIRYCGYAHVMPMRPPHDPNYTFYLCLPST